MVPSLKMDSILLTRTSHSLYPHTATRMRETEMFDRLSVWHRVGSGHELYPRRHRAGRHRYVQHSPAYSHDADSKQPLSVAVAYRGLRGPHGRSFGRHRAGRHRYVRRIATDIPRTYELITCFTKDSHSSMRMYTTEIRLIRRSSLLMHPSITVLVVSASVS